MTKKKSILSFVLAICLIVPTMFMLTACKKDKDPGENQEQPAAHVHTFSAEWEKDSTGHWHKATCEHASEKGDFAEHTYGNWETVTEAGYGTTGLKQRKCPTCEFIDTETISALDAKPNPITVEEESLSGITYNAKQQPINEYVSASYTTGMEIKYKGTGDTTYTTTAPTNAGTYEYTITIPATAEWKEAVNTGSFTIKPFSIKCPNPLVSYLRNGETTTNVLQEFDLGEGTYGIESEDVVKLIYDNNGETAYYSAGRTSISPKRIKIDNSNFILTNLPTGNSATIEWVVADENDRFGFRVTENGDTSSCYIGTIQHGYVKVGDKLTIIGTNSAGNLVKTNITISKIEYYNISAGAYKETTIATVKREGSTIEGGNVKISFTKDNASAVLPTTVDYFVEAQDMGTINQHQKTQTTTELTFVSSEYRVFKLNIDTTNTIKLTLTNPDTCSFKVLNASTGAEITLESNKFSLSESADILIVVKQGTSTGSHQLTVESIEYTIA